MGVRKTLCLEDDRTVGNAAVSLGNYETQARAEPSHSRPGNQTETGECTDPSGGRRGAASSDCSLSVSLSALLDRFQSSPRGVPPRLDLSG